MPHIITKNSYNSKHAEGTELVAPFRYVSTLRRLTDSLILKLEKHRLPITFTIMLYGLLHSIFNVLAGSAI